MRTRWAWAALLFGLAAAFGCGSKSATCKTGAEGCACFENNTCFSGLTCASHLCVNLGGTGGGGGAGRGGTSGAGGQAGSAAGGTTGAAGTIGAGGASGSGGMAGAAGTGGAAGTSGGGGMAGGAGTIGTGGGGGATGGSGGSGGSSGQFGCQMSDVPPSALIADFDSGLPAGGTYVYSSPPGASPSTSIVNGKWHVTATTVGMASAAQYWAFGIYLKGNAAGTDCVDAGPYIGQPTGGVQFDLSGTIAGTGCSAQYSTVDSAHLDHALDPRGIAGSSDYAPQAALNPTGVVQTIKMPLTGTGAPTGGSPQIGVDREKLTGVQWQFTTAAGTAGGCSFDFTIDNVKFY